MPRKITPPRRKLTDDSEVTHIPIPIQMQTSVFNYKQIIRWVIAVTVTVCSVLFCGIQDTMRYLEFIIVLLVAVKLLGKT